MRVGGLVNTDLNLIVLPERGTVADVAWDWGHFANHLGEAALWIDLPILWVPAVDYFAALGGTHIFSTGKALLSKLNPDDPLVDELQRHVNSNYLHTHT